MFKAQLFIYVVLVVLLGTGNRVSFKIMLTPMANYPTFLNVLTSFSYIPFFGAGWLYKAVATKDITRSQYRIINQYKFFGMAGFASIANVIIILGGVKVSGPMQTLLLQGVVPVTIILSIIFLKSRYTIWQYLGAVVLMVGIVGSMWPFLEQSFFGPTAGGLNSSLIWMLLFLSASVPLSTSSVYTEIILMKEDFDIWYLYTCQSIYQFLLGVLMIPIICLPWFGGVSPFEIPEQLVFGAKCLFGINSLETDNCAYGGITTLTYIGFNLTWNIFILLVIKYGSASLMWVASAITLPLANLCYALPLPLIGSQLPTIYDILGLVLVVVGLCMYNFLKKRSSKSGDGTDEAEEGEGDGQDLPVNDIDVEVVQVVPRNMRKLRGLYYSRLGVDIPVHFPGASPEKHLQREHMARLMGIQVHDGGLPGDTEDIDPTL